MTELVLADIQDDEWYNGLSENTLFIQFMFFKLDDKGVDTVLYLILLRCNRQYDHEFHLADLQEIQFTKAVVLQYLNILLD